MNINVITGKRKCCSTGKYSPVALNSKKGNVVLLAVSLVVFSRTVVFSQNERTEKGNHLD